jgi:polar amino acid transport system substrate-binding protein
MGLKNWTALLIAGLIIIVAVLTVDAAQSDSKLKVGISPFSPFVMLAGEEPIGLSIDFWRRIALKLNVEYEFVECKGVADKLKRLSEGRIDIAIGGITITEQREESFDFTHPQFHTGLDILILRSEKPTVISFISAFFTKNKLMVLAGVLLLIATAGHLIWLVERSSKKTTTTFHHNYFPGVFEGMYWALVTASTVGYGDKVPKRWVGRILAGLLIIMFLPVFGYFIAQLSADMTVRNLKHNITGPADLVGKQVAVVKGTTGQKYMERQRSHIYAFEAVENAYQALLAETVDAVVYDAPNLLYYANTDGKGKVEVVGKLFTSQDYAMALPQGSPLREKINRAVLALLESGDIGRIRSKWFGNEDR